MIYYFQSSAKNSSHAGNSTNREQRNRPGHKEFAIKAIFFS